MSEFSDTPNPPARAVNLVDHGFMDARSKLIDVAAFLDRIDRAGQGNDYRVEALRRAVAEAAGDDTGRARRILEIFSDPTREPIPAATVQGAFGAWDSDAASSGER